MTVMLLGPSKGAVSGVSTHLNQLFHSPLAQEWRLLHFQVGSEGREEGRARKLLRFAFSPLQFAWVLLRQRPQIVHLNTSLEPKSYWRDIVYLLVAKLARRRVLFQVHGGAMPQQFFAGKPLRTWLLRRVLHLADAVVLLAQSELRAYRAFAPDLVLEVIPNAIEVGADPAHKLVPASGPLLMAYVGRLARGKGLFELIEALALAVAAGHDLRLELAGSGPDGAALQARVAALGLQDRVHFAGPLFGAQKDALWTRAHIFGFPTYREGLPYALLESMAARTVPLTCPVGAIPDVMQDGVHGLFVPPGDAAALAAALARLDQDRPRLQQMAAACRQRAEQDYTVERLAQALSRTYRRMQA